VKVPAFILMLAGGWNGEKKGVKCPRSVPRVKSPQEGGSAKRPWEGSLVPSDVPDGLTNINGSEIATQFENSEDYRHL
jgi:hypothetical protein